MADSERKRDVEACGCAPLQRGESMILRDRQLIYKYIQRGLSGDRTFLDVFDAVVAAHPDRVF